MKKDGLTWEEHSALARGYGKQALDALYRYCNTEDEADGSAAWEEYEKYSALRNEHDAASDAIIWAMIEEARAMRWTETEGGTEQ